MENVIYLVYPGLGKTYSAKINKKILDVSLSKFENLNYENINAKDIEKLKGTQIEMKKNPDSPNNLIDFLNNNLHNNKIIVMALKPSNIDFLIKNNFDFVFVMPAEDKIEELKKQYQDRQNTQFVVNRNIENISKTNQDILKYSKKIFYINKHKHLIDLFNDIKLI